MFAPRFAIFPTAIKANLLLASVVAANEMAKKEFERVISGLRVVEVDINRKLNAIDERVLLVGRKPKEGVPGWPFQLNPLEQAIIEPCRLTGIAVETATLSMEPATDLSVQWLAPPELDLVEVGMNAGWLGELFKSCYNIHLGTRLPRSSSGLDSFA
jgi:hypothetical protein